MSAAGDFQSNSDSSEIIFTPTTPTASSHSGSHALVNHRLQDVVQEGYVISAVLSNALQNLTLAADQQSQLYTVISLAEELRDFESPVEFTVGFIGNSGVGEWIVLTLELL
jgi:hypothetical protein